MITPDFLEAFEPDPTEEAEVSFLFNQNDNKIETPLFTITFKKFRMNNNEFDPSRTLVALDIFSLVEKFVVQIARESVRLKQLICGDEALVNGTAAPVHQMFSSEGELKPEYSKNLTAAQIARAELIFAQLMALLQTIGALSEARDKFFPGSTRPMQYAWDSTKRVGIYDLREAITYRIATSPTLAQIRARVEKKQIDPVNYGNATMILGI